MTDQPREPFVPPDAGPPAEPGPWVYGPPPPPPWGGQGLQQPGWAPYGSAPGWEQPRPQNAWAIAALVAAVIGIFPVAIVAGIVGLVQTRRRGERGRGLAIAGLVVGCLEVVLAVVLVVAVIAFVKDVGNDALGRFTDAGTTTVGTCLDEQGTPPYQTVDCTSRHDAEVYVVASLGSDSWPGRFELGNRADDVCYDAFAGYVGTAYDDSDLDYGYFIPDRAEWAAGEHRVVCAVVPYKHDWLVGSVQGSGR